jgi:hypothetical protein
MERREMGLQNDPSLLKFLSSEASSGHGILSMEPVAVLGNSNMVWAPQISVTEDSLAQC